MIFTTNISYIHMHIHVYIYIYIYIICMYVYIYVYIYIYETNNTHQIETRRVILYHIISHYDSLKSILGASPARSARCSRTTTTIVTIIIIIIIIITSIITTTTSTITTVAIIIIIFIILIVIISNPYEVLSNDDSLLPPLGPVACVTGHAKVPAT